MLRAVGHLLEQWLGLNNLSGPVYGFWSGFGSDITEFAILGTLVGIYRHHKCATCFRIGHYPVEETPYKTCHKHATLDSHAIITTQHAQKHPEQHKLFKKRARNKQEVS